MPGSNPRALEKARSLPADMLILDLEDAVVPEAKLEAREMVCRHVVTRACGPREVVVRINGLDTPWGKDDLSAAVAAAPDGVLVPKVTSAGDIDRIDEALDAGGAAPGMRLWVMIEMPLAILNIGDIAARARDTRLAGFVIGTNDLAKELTAVPTPDRAAFQVSLALALCAARAHGLVAVDGVYNDIGNTEGYAAECEQGRMLGFDGKTLIHPSQLEIANRVFSPDPADVAQARAVIEAFAVPENQCKGVIKVNGKMTERLHLEQAQRLVAISRAIESAAADG
jgi:citrate lyase subunit beta/citryl-CoA lyase